MPYTDMGTADVSTVFSQKQPTVRRASADPLRAIRRSLSRRFSHQNTDYTPKVAQRPSQRVGANTKVIVVPSPRSSVISPVHRGFTFHKSKPSEKSGTILRAVPASNTSATAPLRRRATVMANHDNQSSNGCIGPAYNHSPTRHQCQNTHMRTRSRSSSTTLFNTRGGSGAKSHSSPTFAGVAGTYKNGQLLWHHNHPYHTSGQSMTSIARSGASNRSSRPRPKIEVVIPNEQVDEKPLPTSPFFQKPSHSHARTASGETELTYNVSPPSASGQMLIRDSIVSPLSSQHVRSQPLSHASKDSKASKSDMGSPDMLNGTGNSSDDSHDDDSSSVYSSHSSHTSNEAESKAFRTHSAANHDRSSSKSSSVDSSAGARPHGETAMSDHSETRHLASPSLPSRHYARHPPIEHDHEFIPSCSLRPLRVASGPLPRQVPLARTSTIRSSRGRRASTRAMGMVAVHHQPFSPSIRSPTLSEAENDLAAQLSAFSDDNAFVWDDKWEDFITQQRTPLSPLGLARADSVTYDITPFVPPPQLPRKSSRRTTLVEQDGFRLSRVPEDHIVSQLKRTKSRAKDLTIRIPDSRRMTMDTFILSPIPIPPKDIKRTITPEVAEGVIFSILENLESLDDLFACAIVNRGFYRVFKRKELDLMKAALRKMSPPAWEHREICYPGHDQLDEEEMDRPRQEYTPTSFIQYYTRDMYIIAAIKALITDKCQSFMRPEISSAIVSEDPSQAARVDDALWRIWTFCKIFGSGRGREDDIVAQMDWLKGGPLVHQQAATHSALFADDFNETLASAPECFAKGNEGGLTAEQLFDMMELWNCLGVLLQPIEGRTIQAREYGIYENTNVRGGDIDGEELMLDEWYYYLLTLGLSTILDLCATCSKSDASVFILASQNGWANWQPPMFGGTRRNFLKEAASRLYEENIASTYAENSNKDVQRALSKQRIQKHISELRQRKNSGERLDVVRMSQERPISEWEGVINNLIRPLPIPATGNNLVSHIPSLHSANLSISGPELPTQRTPSPLPRPRSPQRRIVAQPLLPTPPPSTVPSTRDRSSLALSDTHPAFRQSRSGNIPEMPRLDEHPTFAKHMRNMSLDSESDAQPMSAPVSSVTNSQSHSQRSSPSLDSHAAFQQHPIQRIVQDFDPNVENTADRAVYRIVEMGFTPEQARQALRRTDMGDGLRVDRAVELLLRGM
ncbi:hypothetical protein BU23DRAFT_564686 [Bimuria novae-zelandiae CBS 107.79]|uniref:UBA domain-containing protein n=1 Tax=Bimuria novae-zelandiae CBS 107.79 TaxID=1447943 RepID=A0A6A5VQ24_9PLEO|nr:hypothetical protein BU23DRAFT_564686 [Bimuria novae-zelandiae CBS 107.79]